MAVTSGDPVALSQFAAESSPGTEAMGGAADAAQTSLAAVNAASSFGQLSLPVLAKLQDFLGDLRANQAFATTVAQALRSADAWSSGGVLAVSDSAIGALVEQAGGESSGGYLSVDPASLLGFSPTSGFVDDPVCMATGNFFHHELDLAFPGRASVLGLRRSYNSLAGRRSGAFGWGWSSLLDVALMRAGSGFVLRLPDGAEIAFVPDGAGLVHQGRPGLSFEASGAGWVVKDGPASGFEFASSGELVARFSGRSRVVLERQGGVVWRLVEQFSGRRLELSWGERGVVSARSSDGRAASYAYSDVGELVSVDRPAGSVGYGIASGLLASVTDADGVVLVANAYDEAGRVTAQTSPFGRVSSYRYGALGTTVVTDQAGLRNAFVHDAAGNCTAMVDGAGRVMRMAYDTAGHRVGWRDRRGATWRVDWAGNRPVKRRGPLGVEERFSFDDQGRIVAWASPSGTVRWSYAGTQRTPWRTVGAGGAVTEVEVSGDDLAVAITDADGVRVSLGYDADGQPSSVTDALGNTTSLSYDAAGHLAAWRKPSSITASFEADGAGRVLSAVTPGSQAGYEWSPAGRAVAGTDPAEGAWASLFGTDGALASIRDGAGGATRFGYDHAGNLVSVTGPDGRAYQQGFDPQCALVSMTDPAGGTWTYQRDGEGALVSALDPVGRESRWERDELGRVVAEVDGAGRTWHRVWGAQGRLERVIDPSGEETVYRYDDAGHVVSIGDAAGMLAEYAWTAAGRLLSRRLASGSETWYRYDTAGRLAGVGDEEGSVSFVLDVDGKVMRAEDERRRVISLARDAAGRVVSVTDRTGVVRHVDLDGAGRVRSFGVGPSASSLTYDGSGQLVSAVDAFGAGTGYGYDVAGRLASVTDPLGGISSFGYDGAGRLDSVSDPAGATTVIERDASGALAGLVLPDGSGQRFLRDSSGLLSGLSGSDGSLDRPIVEFPRDAAGQLVGLPGRREVRGRRRSERLDLPVNELGRVSASPRGDLYRHDAAGQLVEWVPPGGRPVAYRYDAGGRLVAESEGSSIVRWSHHASGRVVRRVGPSGEETRYAYDAAGRRVREVASLGDAVAYQWDAAGRLVGVSRGERAVEIEVDALGLPVSVGGIGVSWEWSSGWPEVASIGEVTFERAGSSVAAVHPDGDREELAVDWTGSVGELADPWGVYAAEGSGSEPHVRLGYRGELVVEGLVWLGARVYDPATRSFLSPDLLENPPGMPCAANPYHYAWNDPVSLIDPAGLRPLTQKQFEAMKHQQELGTLGKAWQAVKKDPLGDIGMGLVAAAGVGLMFVPGGQVFGAAILISMAASAGVGLATGSFNPRAVAIAGVVGGASAATGGALEEAAPLVQDLAQGAVQAGGQLATQASEGQPIDWRSAALTLGTAGLGDGEDATQLSLANDANDAASVERRPWTLTEEKATAVAQGGPFNTKFYQDPSDGRWWTKDLAGHGGSTFKVYDEGDRGLEWYKDADQFGDYLNSKWKGGTGRSISWTQLWRK